MKKPTRTVSKSNNDKIKRLLLEKENELKKTKRQLEIEAALERVRSLTMVMKRSGDLSEIILTVYKELRQLDMALTRTLIWLFSENPDMFEVWIADTEDDKTSFVMKQEVEHPYHKRMFQQWKKRKPKWVYVNEGEGKKDLDDYLFTMTAAVAVPEEVKAGIRAVDKIVNSFSFHNFGCLQADGEEELSKENFEILYRFAKEFDLAYTRFLDLQKAEAQARDAQIEAALERVRAGSMAMRKGDELADTAMLLFEQFTDLGIHPRSCGFLIMDEPTKTMEDWSANLDEKGKASLVVGTLKFDQHPMISKVVATWRRGDPYFIGEIHGSDLQEYFKAITLQESTSNAIKDQVLDKTQSEYTNSFYFKYGMMYVLTQDPLNEDDINLLLRFAGVFKMTYTRFLDLQKAEAQTQEAEIQLALERVRARTMAMHLSEELKEVIAITYEQLTKLGLVLYDANIVIKDSKNKTITFWGSGLGGVDMPPKFTLSYLNNEILKKMFLDRDQNNGYHEYLLTGDEFKKYWHYLLSETELKKAPKAYVEAGIAVGEVYLTHIPFELGWLEVASGHTLTSENIGILQRFGSVVGLTYKRFEDIKKAEAQAREAKIEAALERVRAASMAMHSSDELQIVIRVLFDQIYSLGIPINSAQLCLVRPNDKDMYFRIASEDEVYFAEVRIPYIKHPLFDNFWDNYDRNRFSFSDSFNKKEKNAFFKHCFANSTLGLVSDQRKKAVLGAPGMDRSQAIMSHVALSIINYLAIPYSEKDNALVLRFGEVFNQSYIRFLDLQKAEAQAREAQIEAALERVRAQTMAMHNSEDVGKCTIRMFSELTALGVDEGTRFGIGILNHDNKNNQLWTVKKDGEDVKMHIGNLNMDSHPLLKSARKAWKAQVPLHQYVLEGEDLRNYYQMLNTAPDYKIQIPIEKLPQRELSYGFIFEHGFFYAFSPHEFKPELIQVIQRFSLGFSQTYRRYLDLVKAEAQAREAQIEAALERIRARALAMHSSSELTEVAQVLREQMGNLGQAELQAAIVHLYPENSDSFDTWFAIRPPNQKTRKILQGTTKIPKNATVLTRKWYELYLSKDSDYTVLATGAELEEWIKERNKRIPEIVKFFGNKNPSAIHYFFCDFSGGSLVLASREEPSSESKELLSRASKVFDLAYKRFIDLQKAETQAREAEIQLALERVRARSMAMHKSEELAETAAVLFQQFDELGVKPERINIGIVKEEERIIEWWSTEQGGKQINQLFKGSIDEATTLSKVFSAWKKGKKLLVFEQSGKELTAWLKYLTEELGLPFKKELRQARRYQSTSFFTHGMILMSTPEPLSEETMSLLPRFAKVFEQSYVRFLDLQKAETQAREAQIEAALERVRAQAMAMHNTDDLGKTIEIYFEQLDILTDTPIVRCGAGLLSKENTIAIMSTASRTAEGDTFNVEGTIDMQGHPLLKSTYQHWLNQEEHSYVLRGREEIREYYGYITNQVAIPIKTGEELYFYFPMFAEGSFYVVTNQEMPDGELEVFRRFSSVLSLTYRRFNDLKKAENQAREAQIEASLERVRAKAMAMHNSSDLVETVNQVFGEFDKLEISFLRCGIIRLYEDRTAEIYTYSKTESDTPKAVFGTMKFAGHELLEKAFVHWKRQEEFKMGIKGDSLKRYYQLVSGQVDVPGIELDKSHYAYGFYMPEGALYVWTNSELKQEHLQIMRRFQGVLELTYRRFIELQESEIREREAIKQASLDRVRGEIASMRTTGDLERITPLIWKELTALNVPFIRCGVFIMDDDEQIIHNFLSTPDGKAIATFHLPYETPGAISRILSHWQENKILLEHWDEVDMKEFAGILVSYGIFKTPDQYLNSLPKGGFYLHFLPFLQGMLYVGNPERLKEDEVDLVQSLARAFSTAYARYEDFNKLEEAKNKIELTLSELKAAQTQLIQSEKMASLGELTAGIAHEIQNPLNFVNNFSEVSAELLEELEEEIENGNLDEVKTITSDLFQNLEKINHHGQRASSIVKGMLEHSRTGNREKELTDLNTLADEYLRLAYHGLRAKDKSFNADFKTEFDDSLPKVHVIPQDIGRVMLNLINNAFYAVQKKAARHAERSEESRDYKPEVIVTTKSHEKSIEISVQDNGEGIPEQFRDKIFQPFFTTKPTGSGTGLGLSLSYDIVKAHGGEIQIDTKLGEKTDMIIKLPFTQ